MWVMVSGIKRREDAEMALNLGASAYGLVVEQAKNSFLSPERATFITKSLSSTCEGSLSFEMKNQREYRDLVYSLPTNGLNTLGGMKSLCGSVLVTHITDVREIIRLARMIGVTILQLVGDTTSEDIIDIKNELPYIKVIKSLPVMGDACIAYVKRYVEVVDAIELDTFDSTSKRTGGTGRTHDWNISKIIVEEYGWKVPIILAGGLHYDNIEKAIQTVRPVGLDVSSGIKNSAGIQDNEKLAAFISRSKHCANRLSEQPGHISHETMYL